MQSLKSYFQAKPEVQKPSDEFKDIEEYYQNPFKNPPSFLEKSCLLKCLFMGVTSYAMGIGFGAFMHVHATDAIDYNFHRNTRTQMKLSMLEFGKKIRGTARGFTSFGILYSIFDCQLERLRKRTDTTNSFLAGGLTTFTLALDSGMKIRGLTNTFIFGGFFAFVMEELMDGYMH